MNTTVVKVTTTGGDGVAAGAGVSAEVIRGNILGVYLNFHATAPATTDTTVATTGNGPPAYNILVVTSSVTDGFFAPAVLPVSTANAAITNAHRPVAVCDTVTVTLAQCNALTDAVVAHILWEP